MNLFQDPGFDMLPRNPIPVVNPVITPGVSGISETFTYSPGSSMVKKGYKSPGTVEVIVILLIVALIGGAIYMARKEEKEKVKNKQPG